MAHQSSEGLLTAEQVQFFQDNGAMKRSTCRPIGLLFVAVRKVYNTLAVGNESNLLALRRVPFRLA